MENSTTNSVMVMLRARRRRIRHGQHSGNGRHHRVTRLGIRTAAAQSAWTFVGAASTASGIFCGTWVNAPGVRRWADTSTEEITKWAIARGNRPKNNQPNGWGQVQQKRGTTVER